MRKSIFGITLMVCLFMMSNTTYAQQTFDWDAYEISIDLPNDFSVTKNNDNEFEVVGEGMEVYMYIFEADISLSEMEEATTEAAIEMDLDEWDVVQSIETRGFEGKYIAAYLNGDAVLLCGLINPDNITNFFVLVTFYDDDENAEEAAFEILHSIRR